MLDHGTASVRLPSHAILLRRSTAVKKTLRTRILGAFERVACAARLGPASGFGRLLRILCAVPAPPRLRRQRRQREAAGLLPALLQEPRR